MDSFEPGTLLARRYRLIDRIGVGGMSVIWRARDEMLERNVAVKVLADELAADSRCRDLVRAEARAAAALVHPHITATYDYGETVNADGQPTSYVVMELLEGESLAARLTEGPLPWTEALRVCAQVAEALAAAHRHGIVHRDVTTDNVMLTPVGAKVLDFGIATTVGAPDDDSEGLTFGTPAYVAPERLDGRRARPANDTYALGVLLYETLTGGPPFPAETWEELAEKPRGEPPRLQVAGLPEPVADLCARCLAEDPQQRPTAHQVAWTLRRHLPGAGRRTHRVGLPRALAGAGVALALGVGLLLGATLLGNAPPNTPPDASAPSLGGQSPPGGSDGPPSPPPGTAPATTPHDQPVAPGKDALPDDRPGAPDAPADDADGQLTGNPEVTLDTVRDIVAEGFARGDMSDHVALDLHQLIDNLQYEVENGEVELATGLAELRDKVKTREREGTLGASSAAELYAALDQLIAEA
ncbi:MAG TPA: serine/threonine-protein kinase [Natronosporangium sp.]|nr:serine/threonine-protein kinase [Natronosporangium sp.]